MLTRYKRPSRTIVRRPVRRLSLARRRVSRVSYRRRNYAVPRNRVRMGRGFPKIITFTHRYAVNSDLVSNAGARAIQNISANDIYRPFGATFGAASGYDRIVNMYNHFTVIGSRIRVTATSKTAANTVLHVGIYLNDDQITPTALTSTLQTIPSTVAKIMPAASTNKLYFMKSWSAKKQYGGSVMGNNNLSGTAGFSPDEQMFYSIFMQPTNITSSETVVLNIVVDYITVWTERKDVI